METGTDTDTSPSTSYGLHFTADDGASVFVALRVDGLTDGERFTLARAVKRALETEEAFQLEAFGTGLTAFGIHAYTESMNAIYRDRLLEVRELSAASTAPTDDGADDDEEQPCPDCECYPSQPAEGSDGDPTTPYYRSWVCTCACHEPAYDGAFND